MPTTNSPTAGKFTAAEVCSILGVEEWIFEELVSRRAIAPESNGMYSEFNVARVRSDPANTSFISKLRRNKDGILALRKELASRTREGQRQKRHDAILKPTREEELRAEVQELRSMVTELLAANKKPALSGVVNDDEE